jgi:hypothetical protein
MFRVYIYSMFTIVFIKNNTSIDLSECKFMDVINKIDGE